ncbi:neutral/alkaline non-lysosomal ceramidase N-terminal domain-containing protein [Aureliella helgolandensis]|uniref:neutral/alkaline non-lysosomal ceramidase N-terminal domain-containing protein n=1 Tax=Aureliella helgolandensis TaxID=2527968 RepID=UPI0018D18FBA|nr:neutral/alkaline non-lysosomal ceramidase N-terminal domain-containing protein [Aureliella helgolandensis]
MSALVGLVLWGILGPSVLLAESSASTVYSVGVAKQDVTPQYPVRLSGFAFRKAESEGVSQALWARALAIGTDQQGPVVLVTLDSLGVRAPMVDEVARRLAEKTKLTRERLIVTFTHTHCAPKVNGAADNIFAEPIPPEHQAHLDRYSEELVADLVSVVERALADRQPAKLSWAVGEVGFAANRRTKGGPVDHSLPCLVVRSAGEPHTIRAIYTSYACHCVTLSHNLLSGDWAGYAAEAMERHFPDAIAMVSIGCGADQNPDSGVTGDKTEVALQQGMQIGDEVARLVHSGEMQSLSAPLETSRGQIELPFHSVPTRQEYEVMQAAGGPAGYNAGTQLARLDRGEVIPSSLPYPIQECHFGDQLCMVFLSGEVCVDYSLRLKQELDERRLWVHGYSHDFGSYIPSERLWKEGGYGAGAEIPYFALPDRLASGLEQKIVDEVKRLVPVDYRLVAEESASTGGGEKSLRRTNGVAPKTPEDSIQLFQTHAELQVQLVASEPQVVDPVAIDFGPDGDVWVVQMVDYGHGIEEEFVPQGEVRVLKDEDGDGRYESSQVFLDGLRYPTDVKVWRDGALVCDAPDILFARDRDGDGRADTREVLFSGFETHNGQARVNSLQWGLDHWLYGSGGLFGGRISNQQGDVVDVSGRDFRIQPDLGLIEPVTGRSQQGRVRDDWGNWFGCDNSTLLRHYPVVESYVSRNPFVVPPATAVSVPDGPAAGKLFPASDLVMFRLSGAPGRATAACGVGIYRDRLLGAQYAGSSFTCEPVNQLVYRQVLSQQGAVVRGRRAENEQTVDFLTSSDRWFRPVQARTGPDGSLWIVDMYRYVIEHPKWIPDETLAELDVFAGQGMGRIYRVSNAGEAARPQLALSHMKDEELARAIDTENGIIRDLVHQMLLWRDAQGAAQELERIARESPLPAVRIQALAALDGLHCLSVTQLLHALGDSHPEVRRQAVRLAEQFADHPSVVQRVLELGTDEAFQVRLQVANSLGEFQAEFTSELLARLATESSDPYLQSAALSSLTAGNVSRVAEQVLTSPESRKRVGAQVVATAAGVGDASAIDRVLSLVLEASGEWQLWQMESLAQLLDGLDRRAAGGVLRLVDASHELNAADQTPIAEGDLVDAQVELQLSGTHRQAAQSITVAARQLLQAEGASDGEVGIALKLLGRRSGAVTKALLAQDGVEKDSQLNRESPVDATREIAQLIDLRYSQDRQSMALHAIARRGDAAGGQVLLGCLPAASPQVRVSLIEVLLAQPSWDATTLEGLQAGVLTAVDFDAGARQRFLARQPATQRELVEGLLINGAASDRNALVSGWRDVAQLTADPQVGQSQFAKHCSACHKFNDVGHEVGPDLAALTSRSTEFLLTAILNPNRDVDARYQGYVALMDDGSVLSGQMSSETATSITLLEQGGKQHVLLRNQLVQLRATGKSAMPEGLEKDLSKQDLANIMAYVQGADSEVYQRARKLLDDTLSQAEREQVIAESPQHAAAMITALTADMPEDSAEEYRRIPWIWRVAIAAGKRNQSSELLQVLEISLPRSGEPLQDWQAVVIGGGLINGVSLVGSWPLDRIQRLISGNGPLVARWNRSIALASQMADDGRVRAGTRYDALRMVALAAWAEHGEQLAGYLADENAELQMGAVSGLSDMPAAEAGRLLVEALPRLAPQNRELALDALMRTVPRIQRVLAAVQAEKIDPQWLGGQRIQQLSQHTDVAVRELAAKVLGEASR